MTTDILTESFCERCGAKFIFETPRRRRTAQLGGVRTFARGLRNYVLSDESLDEALAEARRERERAAANHQLEAFHSTFNFCIDCRQYTCTDCWNDVAGRCRSCAPLGDEQPATASTPMEGHPFGEDVEPAAALLAPTHDVPGTNGRTQYRGVVALGAQRASDVAAWPSTDLIDAPGHQPARAPASRVESDAFARAEGPALPAGQPQLAAGAAVSDPAWSDTKWAAEQVEPSPITAAQAERMAAELERLEAEEAELLEAEEIERRLAHEAREQAAAVSLAGRRVSPPAIGPEELEGAVVVAASPVAESAGEARQAVAEPPRAADAEPPHAPTEPMPSAADGTVDVAATVEVESEGAVAPAAAAAEAPAVGAAAAAEAPTAAAVSVGAAIVEGAVADARIEAVEIEPAAAEPPQAAEEPTGNAAAAAESMEVAAAVEAGFEGAVAPAAATAEAPTVGAAAATEAPIAQAATTEAAVAPAEKPATLAAPPAPAPPRAPATNRTGPPPAAASPRPTPAPTPQEPAAQSAWQMVAPEETQPPAAAWPPRTPVYRPPAPPPAPQPSHGFALFRRRAEVEEAQRPAVIARPPAQAVWDESSRGVLARPGSGVQACVSCGLPLSASARFCRRCGSRQG